MFGSDPDFTSLDSPVTSREFIRQPSLSLKVLWGSLMALVQLGFSKLEMSEAQAHKCVLGQLPRFSRSPGKMVTQGYHPPPASDNCSAAGV